MTEQSGTPEELRPEDDMETPGPGRNLHEALGVPAVDGESRVWPKTLELIEARGYRIDTRTKARGGASAVVYKGYEKGARRNVALKVIVEPSRERSKKMLEREVKALSSLELPKVVVRYHTTLAADDGQHQPVLVLEWINGQSLAGYLRSERISVDERLSIARRILGHVAELHQSGYFWRDLSPNNILLDDKAELRFIDFGTAKHLLDNPNTRITLEPNGVKYWGMDADAVAKVLPLEKRDVRSACAMALQVLGIQHVWIPGPAGETLLKDRAQLQVELKAQQIPPGFSSPLLNALIAAHHRPQSVPAAAEIFQELNQWVDDRAVRRRQQRQVLAMGALAAVLSALLLLGWGVYRQEVRSRRLAGLEQLQEQIQQRPNLAHPAMQALLATANAAEQRLSAATSNPLGGQELDGILAELLAIKRQALAASHELEAAEPLRRSLGEVLVHTPWEPKATNIDQRRKQAEERLLASGRQLDEGRFDEAWAGLRALEKDLAQLAADNATAVRAVRARADYRSLDRGVSDRLRALTQYGTIAKRVLDAEALLAEGRYDDSRGPGAATEFAQARAQLDTLLSQNESAEERRLRLSLDETAIATLESRVAALELERDRQSTEREEAQQQRVRLEAEQAALQVAHDQLSAELSGSRSAGAQLQEQLAATQARIEELTRSEAELHAALAQARADLLASTERVQALEAELANLRATGVMSAGPATLAKGASTGPGTFVNSIGARLVRVEPGTFQMGSPESEPGRHRDEPLHTVHLTQPFLIGETEVTQGQWKAVMRTEPWKGKPHEQAGDAVAASYISYQGALEFCRRLTDQERAAGRLPVGWEYGLPTEAQWEYACRAATTTAHCSGNSEADFRRVAIFASSRSGEYAHRVKSKEPNAWGLYDMHGNVWEWTRDAYSDGGGFEEGQTDPFVNGDSFAMRVVRGGSWSDVPWRCRSAIRREWVRWIGLDDQGFRLCLLPGPGAPPEAR
jgi:formylglycine-generating enzyme required for sulfatase activity/tRNA A-37 threonylcarbamoyl transferase component Bud32